MFLRSWVSDLTNHCRAPSLNPDPPGKALTGQGPPRPWAPQTFHLRWGVLPRSGAAVRGAHAPQGTQGQPLPWKQLLSHTDCPRLPSAPSPAHGAGGCSWGRGRTGTGGGSLPVSLRGPAERQKAGPAGDSRQAQGHGHGGAPATRNGSSSECSAQGSDALQGQVRI